MLVLIDFPAALGLRSLSPFAYKAEALLTLCGCDYRKEAIADLSLLPHGKVPVLRDGDLVIPDSSLIQRHLERHHGLAIDAQLTDIERAMAEAFRRMAEEHLRWTMVHARWIDPAGEEEIIAAAFSGVPEAARRSVFLEVREQVRQSLHMQGIGRHTAEEIYTFGRNDLDAIASFLDDKPFLMGDRPTSVDAFIAGLMINMLTSRIDTPLTRHAWAIPTFADYVVRFEREVFGPRAMLPARLAEAAAA
ncbi:glutathione S-transferase family protein [Stappia sp. ES.058]|uniref:glutathione S-transferase family protein n=1 Tax=Stappia sp. ES.058 TaxID=1881061 RepID=UPI00087C3685|nr:glutathione S-transferase family protein [Stappia sp. ES.058]SDU13299.1 Glutathione S-transferase [Stappia sp. ES.058]